MTGLVPRLFGLGENHPDAPFSPYSAGVFGTGANFVVSRVASDEIGLLDEALGAGSPAAGWRDLDMFVRVILGGWTLAYEPAAIAWHVHPA